jgi:hypothetical protein
VNRSPSQVLFPVATRTPAGEPEYVPVIVDIQVFTTFFLDFLPPDLARAQVDLEAGLGNA